MDHIPKSVLDHFPEPVLLIGRKRVVLEANRAARELLDIGRIGQDLAQSIRHPEVLEAVETVIAGGKPRSAEVTLPGPVARTVSIHAESLAEEPDSGNIAAVLVLHDVTTAKRTEQMRADFVANASHELRSPLSSIIGFIETLMDPAKDDPEARERFLEIMLREARRMTRLIDDLLSLSRVEINEHVRPKDPVSLGPLLDNVIETLVVKAEDKGMRIELACDDGLPPATGDAEQLVQVFHNLIENAIKYGRADTAIDVHVASVPRIPGQSTPGISVSVTDRGDGIPAEAIPRLTERFYRVDKARARSLGSTGLGLAICKHIINRHRGRLTIDSTLGQGSTFTVHLPVFSGQPASAAPIRTDS